VYSDGLLVVPDSERGLVALGTERGDVVLTRPVRRPTHLHVQGHRVFFVEDDRRIVGLDVDSSAQILNVDSGRPFGIVLIGFAGNRLIFGQEWDVVAMDIPSSTRIWQSRCNYWVGASEPAVVVGVQNTGMIGLDPRDGHELWRAPSGGEPSIVDGLIVFDSLGELHAYDPATGRRLWTSPVLEPRR
jgi:outer membrane protein assembly factor BamB